MSLSVGYEYRDVTACGLRIQRHHCPWVTNTETSLPVGYEYRRHCPWVTNTETSLPVRFAHTDVTDIFSFFYALTLLFETDKKDPLLENYLREIIALLSSEC